MPTYDYLCDECGHEFEAFESITASPQSDCPECKVPKLRRKIGPGAAILFKGSGFYQTDYRSESYKKAEKAEKSPDSGSATKSDAGKTSDTGNGTAAASTTSSTTSSTSSKSAGTT